MLTAVSQRGAEATRQSEHELLRQSAAFVPVTRFKLLHALLCLLTRA